MAETKTIGDLAENGYRGCSIFSLLRDSQFRNGLLKSSDPIVRGNLRAKNEILDQLAVSAKTIIVGPAGEGKSLFARSVLEALASQLSSHKHKIAECPVNEDAAILCMLWDLAEDELGTYLKLLGNSLCPRCYIKLENLLSDRVSQSISLTRTKHIMQNFDRASLLSAIESLETERVNIQAAQIDPRTDPDSIYMLLAGVENLERLLGDKTTTTFDPTAHKLGVLSQGLILINEIHRLPLRLLESLMGFLEEAGTLRYSISGRMLTIDGAIIFTANSSLRQLGEDITPIVSRIPMVLWPARSLEERREIVRDIFQEHNRRASSPLGYSILGTLSPQQESSTFVSRLVIELLARVASLSFPEALFLTTRPREFLRALETTQSIPKAPFFDTRSLYQFIGKLFLSRERIETMNPVVIEHVLPSLSDLGFVDETGKAIYEIKDLVTETILGFSTDQLSIEAIERERRILDRRIEESEEFEKAVLRAEGLESAVKRIPKTIIEQLRESYMHILEDH